MLASLQTDTIYNCMHSIKVFISDILSCSDQSEYMYVSYGNGVKTQNMQTACHKYSPFLKKTFLVTKIIGEHANNEFPIAWKMKQNLFFTAMLLNKAVVL